MTLGEPTESEKQVMQAKSYISDSFWLLTWISNGKKHLIFGNNREFDRSLTPKMGDNNEHLEQVRRFILKNGFQETIIIIIIISCDLKRWRCLYHWRQPSSLGGPQGRCTIHTMLCNSSLVVPKWFLYIARYWFITLKPRETILPENLGLTVAKTGFN